MGRSDSPDRQSPRMEAVALFKLLLSDQTQSAEMIRSTIMPERNAGPPDLYREEILRLFDLFVSRGCVCKVRRKKSSVAQDRKDEAERFRIRAQLERIRMFVWRAMQCWFRWQQGQPLEEPEEIAQVVTSQSVEPRPIKSPEVIRRNRKPLTAEEIATANKAISSGASTRDIARRFGVSAMTIQRHCLVRRRRRRGEPITKDWQEIQATIQAEKARVATA